MARPPRIDFPYARHHVMNRGARRAPVLAERGACIAFLSVLGEASHRFELRIHGYALMPNHYHLMVESVQGNLSDAMRFIGSQFTMQLNREYEWDGPVFRGRFRNQLVESDAYWMHLLAYLHLNPVRAHLATSAASAEWTSHAAYLGKTTHPDWLIRDELLDQFGGPDALAAYIADVREGRRADPEGFRPERLWVPTKRPANAPQVTRPSVAQALEEVRAVCGWTPPAPGERRPLADAPREWLATWWAWRRSGRSMAYVAAELGISRVRVLQRARALEDRVRRDQVLAGWVARLEELARWDGGSLVTSMEPVQI